ncbi:MAG TPA: hypothetical protein VEW46_00990, partial [Pyrinomonadaceae bacterium]|nr:hypothetical protein [Pyrinomonadaceae bacterium]
GPLPKGTPVSLLANLNILYEGSNLLERGKYDAEILKLLLEVKRALKALPRGASDEEATRVLTPLVPQLLKLSKCPDLVVNRGHYFGTHQFQGEPGLSDEDKRALIEFLKTF